MFRNNVLGILADSLSVARVVSKHGGIHRGLWYFVSVRTRGLERFLFDCYSVLYSRAFGRSLIYVIGDSHGKVFRGNRQFIVHHLGAATAHNLANQSSTTNSNRKLFDIIDSVRQKDVVLLVFGEIDCRIHIYYQYKKNNERKAISELVDDTVSNYGEVLEKLRNLGVNFIVYGVPPATEVRNEYRYPFYASPETHCQISSMFNGKLKELCQKKGYQYIDVHSRFSDENGFMLEEYAADEIHLNRQVVDFMKGELNRRLGISV